MSILPSLKLDEIPVEKATPLSGYAIVGELTQKEISGGFVQINIPLFYLPQDNNTENGVAPTDVTTLTTYAETVIDRESAKATGLRTFNARFNVKPEWLEPSFAHALRAGHVDANERTAYNINIVNIARGLFKAIGMAYIDFDAVPMGAIVGFKAASSKSEPDRLQVRLFYPPKRG